jgi:2-keto-3-deoxy-L-rhamnonate aldolase RhmA
MKTNIVDVFIYIQSKGIPEVVSGLADHISQVAGVAKVRPHPDVRQLIAVEYDLEQTSGKKLIDIIKQNGCSGFLVGM